MSTRPSRRIPTKLGVGVTLLVLGVVVALVAYGWSYWLCNLASYSCPADGCDDVPQHNCQASIADFELGVAFAVVIGILGAILILGSWRTRGQRPR